MKLRQRRGYSSKFADQGNAETAENLNESSQIMIGLRQPQ